MSVTTSLPMEQGTSPKRVHQRLLSMERGLSFERGSVDLLFAVHRVLVLFVQVYNLQGFSVVRWNWPFILLAGTVMCCQPLLPYLPPFRSFSMWSILITALLLFNAWHGALTLELQHSIKDCSAWFLILASFSFLTAEEPPSRGGFRLGLVVFSALEGAVVAGFFPMAFLTDQHAFFDPEYCIALIIYMIYASSSLQLLRLLTLDFVESFVAMRSMRAKEDGEGAEAQKPKGGAAPPSNKAQPHTGSLDKKPGSVLSRAGQWLLQRAGPLHNTLVITEGCLVAALACCVALHVQRWEVALVLFPFHAMALLLLLRVRAVNSEHYSVPM